MGRILCLLICLAAMLDANADTQWSLVIDAGSTGSRMRIYYWDSSDSDSSSGIPTFNEYQPSSPEDAALLEVNPGLSSFIHNVSAASAQVLGLIEQAARWVPAAKQANSPLHLGATAGLRLFSTTEQQHLITTVCESVIKDSPFKYEEGYMKVLSGEEEAVFGWLSVNYMEGTWTGSGRKEGSSVGVMDMGGASTQVAFVPQEQLLANSFGVKVAGKVYTVYATSYLYYGNNQFKTKVFGAVKAKPSKGDGTKKDPYATPCQCNGFEESVELNSKETYFIGTGAWDECKNITDSLMYPDAHCLFEDAKDCAINGKYMADIAGSFYGISEFFYTVHGLGLVGWEDATSVSLDAIEAAGREFCKDAKNASKTKFGADFCRNSAYIVSLLTRYGFKKGDDAQVVTYTRKVNGLSADWSLGLVMYYEELFKEVGCGHGTHLNGTSCLADSSGGGGSSSKSGGITAAGIGVGIVIGGGVTFILCLGFYVYRTQYAKPASSASYQGLNP